MAVPEFHRFFRPILELLQDGVPRSIRDIEAGVVKQFNLTPQEIQELLPSGQRTRVEDRVRWGLTYLRQAQLIENPRRGVSQITPSGKSFLTQAPNPITPADLMQFPSFAEFQKRTKSTSVPVSKPGTAMQQSALTVPQQTPGEAMAAAFEELNAALAEDLLERVKKAPPAYFEHLIVQLMLRLGYGTTDADAGQVLGQSGDEGVDGVISEDKLGLEKIYLQAKRWSNGTVGRKEIQSFVGALTGQKATKGVFMTTSTFSKEAREFARNISGFKVSLVDGYELARLMIQCNLGVSLVETYQVKQVDTDYFPDD